MYFPSNMTFQYFFFDTYIGYFLQALPIALLISAAYVFIRYRKDNTTPLFRKIFSCIFVCYMVGLFCLVIGFEVMGKVWYELLYHMESDRTIRWFSGEFAFDLDFAGRINAEVIVNFLMFLPYGILHPLSKANSSPKNTVLIGFASVLAIEVFQPIVGRAFDLTDVILNTLGIVISTSVFFGIKYITSKKQQR